MKKVLVLGAGYVSRPLVRYLLEHDFELTVADCAVERAKKLVAGHPRGRALFCNIDNAAALAALVRECDVAISLLPAVRHIDVAKHCLDAGKHMVTASYVSPQMRALDGEAKKKGLLFLNELGVDPGLDHMSAMSVIHQEQRDGATLVGFSSWCGGLPAPEANDNPFGYKFSWSPKGVLLAARNSAKFLRDGKLVEIPNERLFSDPPIVDITNVGSFEGYPNRDSVSYIDTYGFDANVKDMFRGTLRNHGHCKLFTQLIRLGILEDSPQREFKGLTYRALMEQIFGRPLEQTIPQKLGLKKDESPFAALAYIGLLDEKPVEIERGSLMDMLADRMNKALQYKPGERDMLIMKHDMTFTYDKGARRERVTALLVDYGIPGGDSSMARTVSLPAAIAVRLLGEGKIAVRGVRIPVLPEIFQPILAELERLKISFVETRVKL